MTEFTAGITCGSRSDGITAGPDGNLWFTEPGGAKGSADRIGRITPAGVVTELTVGTAPGGCPHAIAAAPDGNVWFTECARGIGRITPSGVSTEFGGPSWSAHGITAGPDGALWFAEGNPRPSRVRQAEAPRPAWGDREDRRRPRRCYDDENGAPHAEDRAQPAVVAG